MTLFAVEKTDSAARWSAVLADIVGAGAGLREVMEGVGLVRGSDVPVLFLGETGSGKEVVARALHEGSPRARAEFVRVNCGAIAPELVDSQLFGHERGSFTGAIAQRKGWFERADGGTLFLDEIGELSPAAQVRLLRVLQDGVLERVGGHEPVAVDCRIVAATHRDLGAMVEAGTFREDLWYRLSVFPLRIPPLRDRPEDIEALVRAFAARSTRFGLAPCEPTPDDLAILRAYAWPGNVRELAAVIDRAAILGRGRCLEITRALGQPTARTEARDRSTVGTLREAVRAHLVAALQATGGRIEGTRGAARLLDVPPATLRSKLRKLAIDPSEFRFDAGLDRRTGHD